MGRCSWWIILFVCFFGTHNHIQSVDSQIIKFPQLPRFRWPTFNRPKKDSPVELKPAATNQDASVTHVYAGGPGSGPHNGPVPQGGPMVLPPHPMPHPSPMGYPPMGYVNPFGPFARPPNPFVFPNIVSGPPPPPPSSSSYYSSSPSSSSSSSGNRKTRRRRPVYDNDSLEDTSTEDEPVYIKVKSRKRRPIVIDEEELLGRGHDAGSSEESPDPPKISYKSRTKPQVVYLDSSREYPSANERRMLIKNEEMVQDAPSYHSPSISALHASIGPGGYQLNSRLASRPSQPQLVFLNNVENSPGPGYSFESPASSQKFRSNGADFSSQYVLQNVRSVDHQDNNMKTFLSESSTVPPTIRIVLNSINQEPKSQASLTTPNPTQHNQAQIPSPQPQSSVNHFQMFEPTQAVFHDKGFQFGSHTGSGWAQPPPPPPPPLTLPPHILKHSDTLKVARRSFPTANFPPPPPPPPPQQQLQQHQHHQQPQQQPQPQQQLPQQQQQQQLRPPMIESFIAAAATAAPSAPPPASPRTPPTTVFMEKQSRKRAPPHHDHVAFAQKTQQVIEFSCVGRRSGYYANRQYKCQIYHQCSKRTLTQTFMCPNGTAFNEKQKLCERAQKVACVPEDNNHRPKTRLLLPTTEVPQISSRMDEGSAERIDARISTSPTTRSAETTTTAPSVVTKYSTSVSYSQRVSSSSSSSTAATTSAAAAAAASAASAAAAGAGAGASAAAAKH